MISYIHRCSLGTLLVSSLALTARAADSPNAPPIEWTQEIGDALTDEAFGIATDGAGSIYVAGQIDADQFLPIAGEGDLFLNKFATNGNLVWQRRVGGAGLDLAWDVDVDSAGNIAAAGLTAGSLAGTNAGGQDILLTKFNTNGDQLWTRQLGSNGNDQAYGVDFDGLGNIYIAGVASGDLDPASPGADDLFVAKFDPAGNRLWTRQNGSSSQETALGIAADAVGNTYVTGWTRGNLGGPVNGLLDSFLRKYSPAGDVLWTRQLGMANEDIGFGVATDAFGNAYLTGYTAGSLTKPNAGAVDGYVIKYDSAGNVVWQDQFGGPSNDMGQEIVVDALGNVYVTGAATWGSLPVPSNLGSEDILLRKYDASGQLVWDKQFGSIDFEQGMAVAVGGMTDIYVAGRMRDVSAGPNSNRMDAFVTKLREIPEPGALLLLACGTICGALCRRPRPLSR